MLTVAALLAGLAVLSPLRRTGRVGLTAVALPLVVLPVAVLFAVSLVKPLFVDRYLLFAFAGFPLPVAAGLERLLGALRSAPWRPVVTAAGVVAVAAAFWCRLPFQEQERGKDGRADDLREVTAYVAAQTRPDDAVLFVPSYQRHISLTYDREFAGRRDIALDAGAAAAGTFYGQEFDAARIGARIGVERRVWVVAWPSAWSEQWFDEDPKITALRKGFELARSTRLKSGLVQLYVRERAGGRARPVSGRAQPALTRACDGDPQAVRQRRSGNWGTSRGDGHRRDRPNSRTAGIASETMRMYGHTLLLALPESAAFISSPDQHFSGRRASGA
ncbi:hypothetical protein [Streptomyces sp. NPDC003863]